jgi:hypothetical protein
MSRLWRKGFRTDWPARTINSPKSTGLSLSFPSSYQPSIGGPLLDYM